jgi:hypothetical protein
MLKGKLASKEDPVTVRDPARLGPFTPWRAWIILSCLFSVVSCNTQQRKESAPADPNPVWTQVVQLKRAWKEMSRQLLSSDLKTLDAAFSSPLGDARGERISVEPGSAAALIHRNSGGWTDDHSIALGVFQAAAPDKVRLLIGIKESENSLGTYYADGKQTDIVARQIIWEARLLSWPDLKPLAGKVFTGGLPDTVIGTRTGGSPVGSLPIAELIEWFSSEIKGPPARPPDVRVISLAFLGNSGDIALLHENDTVTIWDSASGRDQRTFSVRGASHKLTPQRLEDLKKEGITRAGVLMSLASSPDGRRIAVGGRDDASSESKPVTYVWDVDEGKELLEIQGGEDPAFSPDGKRIAVAFPVNGISLWDMNLGAKLRTLPESAGKQLYGFGFTGDGTSIWAVIPGGKIVFWDVSSGKRAKALSSDGTSIKEAAFARGSGTAMTMEEQGVFPDSTLVTRTWNFVLGNKTEIMKWPNIIVRGVAIDPEGKRVAVFDLDAVVVFDPETQRLIRYIEPNTKLDFWNPVTFSPDGRRLALIDQAGRISLVPVD